MQSPRAHSPALAPITLVGSGRVGNALARALEGAGYDVRLVGRDGFEEACAGAETVLLCVPDAEIEAACSRVSAVSPALRFIGHTSGAACLGALSAATMGGADGFSLHPLQTVPDAGADLTGAPAAIAGTSPGAVELARNLAHGCQMVPFEVPEGSRAAYHAAASMASNFLIALEVSAEELLSAAGVEDGRELLAPLVLRTAANWAESGSTALTGPIARGDEETVRRHLEAIEDLAPELADTYRALAERTRSVASAGGRT
jgi:predicted short-subunit dehydrogenase-like oxidoreductase (DUF2520 family)